MKRALVLTLLVLGLGVFAYAGPLTGSWDTDFCIVVQTDGTVTFDSLDSILSVEYATCGWTFGTEFDFGMDYGFEDALFYAGGALGAFQFGTLVDFDPTGVGEFTLWNGYVEIAIAGVDLYAIWAVEGADNAGFMLGGEGTVGDCYVYVEVDFGMVYSLYDDLGVTSPSAYFPTYFSAYYGYFTADGTCTATWQSLLAYVEFPFTCFDVWAEVYFNCTDGFDSISFGLMDVDLGISWLLLDDVVITFTPTSKSVSLDIDIVALDTICIQPYFEVMYGSVQGQIDGVALEALVLDYTWNGVTFIAAEIFDITGIEFNKYCDPLPLDTTPDSGYTGVANEVIGIEIDGDSCCGGSFDAYVYNYFIFGETGTAKIFDWEHTCVGLTYGISSNVILDASIVVDVDGLQTLCFGFEFIW